MDVFFLFPGRVLIVFIFTGSEQTKNPTGQKSFVYFGTFRGDTEFLFGVSKLFFRNESLVPAWIEERGPERLGTSGDFGHAGAFQFALRTLFRYPRRMAR